jgi:putative ABC transport system permease protein
MKFLYRWLLRLCPTALRREYGSAMEETFARRMADARAGGRWRGLQVWHRELTGLIALAVSERWEPIARARRQRRQWRRQWRRDSHTTSTPEAGLMDIIGREIRHAARRLLRAPAFTLPAVLTLALAIGANASMFAVVQRVVLNPLPYPDSDRLITLDQGALGLSMPNGLGLSQGLYFHYRDHARTLDDLALYRTEEVTVTGRGEPERIRAARTTPSLAPVLRVSPAQGRWFSPREGEPGGARVAVLSHALWMRRYGGERTLIGRSIVVDGVPAEVIGIMPAGFAFPDRWIDVWMPEPLTQTTDFGIFGYSGVARMRDGVTLAAARADLDNAIASLPDAFPTYLSTIGYNLRLQAAPVTLKENTIGRVARALWILMASVALVLLIACANVANLFLVRSEARQRDIAVRRALGAGGAGIARYFLTESALLSIGGGLCGLALAWTAVRALVRLGPATLPRLAEIQIDGVAVAFTFALTLLIALVFGTMPMLRGQALSVTLHEHGRANTASRRRHRTRQLLMGGQIALALVLLVASGLMLRSFQKLRAIDPGFDAQSALTFRLGLSPHDYPTRRAAVAAHQAMLERLGALPGVTRVSAATTLPLGEEGMDFGNTLFVDGRQFPTNALPPVVAFRAVAGGYAETMRIRLLRGRTITRGDIDRGEPIAVINEALAKLYFPNEDPLDRRIASSTPNTPTWMKVVGIIANTPVAGLAEPAPAPTLYLPMTIAGGPDYPRATLLGPDVSVMTYVLRTSTPPLAMTAAVRDAIHAIDANLPIVRVQTLQDTLDRASAQMAFTMVLLAIAGSVALLLGTIGIYGVMSYIVSQRTGEIGIRLALGAEPGGVVRMIVRQGGLVALAGIVVGVATAYAGSRFIESLLYEVSARDPGVFAATTLALLAVALIACWLPARRAARIDPTEALRAE